jgi:hypothetical protein
VCSMTNDVVFSSYCSSISTFDTSMNNDEKLYPVCSYMSEEVIGDHALANTTLRELGPTSGTAVIR